MVKQMKLRETYDSDESSWTIIKKEIFVIIDLSVFMILSSYAYCLMFPVSMIYIGRFGTTYLDAVGLGNTAFNVFGILVFNGAVTGCDTTMSQSYGTKNKKMVGVYYQKGVILYSGLLMISMAILLNTETILVLCGQDREISRLAGEYVSVLCLAAHGFGIYQLTLRYFRIQNIVWIAIVAALFNVSLSLLGHYLFIDVFGYDIIGSAYAQTLSYWVTAIVTMILASFQTKTIEKTWGGFSKESLQDWRKFSTLSVAGIFIVCIQWWSIEICTLVAGTMGEVELAAQSIIFQINYFIYTIPICTGISCNILIGQHVGGNRPKIAQLTMRIGWVLTWILGAVNVLLLYLLRDLLPKIYTEDPAVIEMTSDAILYFAFYHICECSATASLGMCRGIARQKMGSVCSFIGFYVIGMPAALSLALKLDMGINGLWLGLSIGLVFESVLIIFLLLRTDWEAECRAAQIRAGLDPDKKNDLEEETVNEDSPLLGTGKPHKRFNSEYSSSQIDITVLKPMGHRLSNWEILVHRGAYFFICFLILAVGIYLHYNFQIPYPAANLCLPLNSSNVANNTNLPFCSQ